MMCPGQSEFRHHSLPSWNQICGQTHTCGYHEPITHSKLSVGNAASQNAESNHEYGYDGKDHGESEEDPLVRIDYWEKDRHGRNA